MKASSEGLKREEGVKNDCGGAVAKLEFSFLYIYTSQTSSELSLKPVCCLHLLPPRFDDFYFLTDPEEFIDSHFPDEETWQLLDMPISLEEFERRVFKTSAFFTMGLRLIQPHYAHIVTGLSFYFYFSTRF